VTEAEAGWPRIGRQLILAARSGKRVQIDTTLRVREKAMADQQVILVVDDDPMTLRVVSRLLTDTGYRVLTASDGEAAWELLQGPLQVDLLLTDVRMPRMGGAELGRRIALSRPEIPVLYMTGFALEVEWELPEDIRSTRLILKPFRSEALLERVATWVSREG
jgi:two-component system, cell cycle sensor histidine kinase and response regulator CckA